MGQVLSDDGSVRKLLSDAGGRLRLRRALDWAARTGSVSLSLVLMEGLVARVTSLPDLGTPVLALLLLPAAAAALAWCLPPDQRAARAEAGRWVGEPALLLALDSARDATLGPLIASQAQRRAQAAVKPTPRHGHLVRALPPLYLLAALFAFAPGRIGGLDRLPEQAVLQIRESGRSQQAEGLPAKLGPDRRQALQAALRVLDQATVSRQDVEAAIGELEAAVKASRGTWDALLAAAANDPVLDPTWRAMRRGDATAALDAIRDLARKIRDGEVDPGHLRRASESLLAAVDGAGSAQDGRLLTSAAQALGAGDASGLQQALGDLMTDLRPPDTTTRQLERTAIALRTALGRPGIAGSVAAPGEAPLIEPRGGTEQAARNAFADSNELDAVHREVLRNYFSAR